MASALVMIPRVLSFLLPVSVLLFASGCPLDIRIRCEDSRECSSGQVCVRGGCEDLLGERVGDDCESDAECGPGFTCGEGFPGGYCLLACSRERPCPEGSVCATDLGRCLRTCGEHCARPGYGCGPVPESSGPLDACVPVATPADGGSDGGCTGAGCVPDAGCSGTVPEGGTCTRPCECAGASAVCDNGTCARTCETDFQCSAGWRCRHDVCVVGPRLGEPCRDSFECAVYASCPKERLRCEETCNPQVGGLCSAGYQCAPDGLCVRECTGTPVSVGEECENSMDCAACSVCVASAPGLRCRQPCRLDRDCPGGAAGACEQVGQTKVCRL
ncbi:hypothetical protein [Myxococcus stipitatus]|uniref:hypothetical protein n=1 Tax=Myxococcus stipitatus TaxID=83455 RepID=UPI0030CDA9AA